MYVDSAKQRRPLSWARFSPERIHRGVKISGIAAITYSDPLPCLRSGWRQQWGRIRRGWPWGCTQTPTCSNPWKGKVFVRRWNYLETQPWVDVKPDSQLLLSEHWLRPTAPWHTQTKPLLHLKKEVEVSKVWTVKRPLLKAASYTKEE